MSVIDDYLQSVDPQQRAELERIRNIVREIAPEAEEVISYKIPAFKYKGEPLVYFTAFKDHLSLFPTSEPVEQLKNKLQDYKISRGTIQFTLDNPLPESLIKELVRIRLSTINRQG